MMDLLETLLTFVLEFVFEIWEWECYWRLFLPVLAALGLVLLIRATVSNSTVQALLGAPAALLGIASGIVWQTRKG